MKTDLHNNLRQETLSNSAVLELLAQGKLRIIGRFPWGSNYTFLAEIKRGDESITAVYKPSRGERPLWDFPRGTLATRELAAYLTSELLGWNLVPPTVLREQGPLDSGSVQLYIDTDSNQHYFTFDEQEKEKLRTLAVFDFVINNADRKGGHMLMDSDGHVWSIDHGISFHEDPKLRTVIWDFSGQTIPDSLMGDLQLFHNSLAETSSPHQELRNLISAAEFGALLERTEHMLNSGRFPAPISERSYPWPLI